MTRTLQINVKARQAEGVKSGLRKSSDLSLTILSLFFPLMHFEQHTELDNLIAMQNLRTSANEESNDAYDVSVSLAKIAWDLFHRP